MRLNHYTNDSELAIDTYFPTTLNKTTLQAPNKTSRCFYQLLTKDKKNVATFKKNMATFWHYNYQKELMPFSLSHQNVLPQHLLHSHPIFHIRQ